MTPTQDRKFKIAFDKFIRDTAIQVGVSEAEIESAVTNELETQQEYRHKKLMEEHTSDTPSKKFS